MKPGLQRKQVEDENENARIQTRMKALNEH